MRRIVFRGKHKTNGEWVEGGLYEHEPPLVGIVPEGYIPEKSKWFIVKTGFADWNMPRASEFFEIDPDTVGQYTGLTDRNGKRIFEGDILRLYSVFPKELYRAPCVVVYGTFNCECCHGVYGWWFRNGDIRDHKRYEIVGNIHDNPELLEVEA